MTNLLKKNERGFTLIEVVLVLAIAGLLLVVVFLAVSGAQKSRRDAQRKEDVSRITGQLVQYGSNNDGNYPTTGATQGDFTSKYLTPAANYTSPNGVVYSTVTTFNTSLTKPVTVPVDTVTIGISGRQYLVCVGLEGDIPNCRASN